MFEKMTELRNRLMTIGAPSEHALYQRKSSSSDRVSHAIPESARSKFKSRHNLQFDSAAIIRGGVYSGTRP